MREKDCDDTFRADASHNFFPRTCSKHKKYDKREPGLFKEEFRCTEMIYLCSKTYCCYDDKSDKYKFSSKGLNKRTLDETVDGPMEKYRRVMDEIINLTSTDRGFRTINHCVATHEQTKKGLSYFYPKRVVLADGMNFFLLMSVQQTIVTQLIKTIRGTIFATDRKLHNQNSACHIITPHIIRVIENPRQLISQFNMT